MILISLHLFEFKNLILYFEPKKIDFINYLY